MDGAAGVFSPSIEVSFCDVVNVIVHYWVRRQKIEIYYMSFITDEVQSQITIFTLSSTYRICFSSYLINNIWSYIFSWPDDLFCSDWWTLQKTKTIFQCFKISSYQCPLNRNVSRFMMQHSSISGATCSYLAYLRTRINFASTQQILKSNFDVFKLCKLWDSSLTFDLLLPKPSSYSQSLAF